MWKIPVLVEMNPPAVLGAAYLTTAAFQGEPIERLSALVARHPNPAARLHDQSLLERLRFQPDLADQLQLRALSLSQAFRVAGQPDAQLRVLAIMLPGDMMANTPLDFLLTEADVRLDLLYHLPGQALPATIPDHDVAVFAGADPSPRLCAHMQRLFDAWPCPAINAPRAIPGLARDALSATLADIPTIVCPPARQVSRQALRAGVDFRHGAQLVRPVDSHAGQGLARVTGNAELAAHLEAFEEDYYFITPFIDYRSPDGLFRKYRIAFIEGAPFLCHMAISQHWMIHYLNAGMTESAAKRAEEAAAMRQFATGFARRHTAAFAALNEVIRLDYYSIDCAETQDGKLLVFEADNAAIVHMMDPPELFPYKRPHMRVVFEAFFAMLMRRSARRPAHLDPQSISPLADVPVEA
jgi:hypothetical protein